MEFSHVGQQCAYDECRQLDFLPFECTHCHQKYCLHHRMPETHKCITHEASSVNEVKPSDSTVSTVGESTSCCAKKCNHIAVVTCTGCKKKHCAFHREATAHSCTMNHRKDANDSRTQASLLKDILSEIAQLSHISREGAASNTGFDLVVISVTDDRVPRCTLKQITFPSAKSVRQVAGRILVDGLEAYIAICLRTGYRLDLDRPVQHYGHGGLLVSGDAVALIPKRLAHLLARDDYQNIFKELKRQRAVSELVEQEAFIAEMGFTDSVRVRHLLAQFDGQLEPVVSLLVSATA